MIVGRMNLKCSFEYHLCEVSCFRHVIGRGVISSEMLSQLEM